MRCDGHQTAKYFGQRRYADADGADAQLYVPNGGAAELGPERPGQQRTSCGRRRIGPGTAAARADGRSRGRGENGGRHQPAHGEPEGPHHQVGGGGAKRAGQREKGLQVHILRNGGILPIHIGNRTLRRKLERRVPRLAGGHLHMDKVGDPLYGRIQAGGDHPYMRDGQQGSGG